MKNGLTLYGFKPQVLRYGFRDIVFERWFLSDRFVARFLSRRAAAPRFATGFPSHTLDGSLAHWQPWSQDQIDALPHGTVKLQMGRELADGP